VPSVRGISECEDKLTGAKYWQMCWAESVEAYTEETRKEG